MYQEKSEFRDGNSKVLAFPSPGSKPKLKLVTTSLQETYRKDLPPPAAIIERTVYQGLTILAGPPKVGKSFLALDLANSVASGEPALGSLIVKRPGRVLYLSLEDGERRIRKRTRQMIATDQYLDRVQMVYDLPAPLSDEGGLEALNHEIHDGQYELVIVDTLVKAFPQERGASDLFRADYRQIDALKGLADNNSVALLVIAHTRKEEAEYALNAVAGTSGLTAAADAILILAKTSSGAKLQVISRDIDESEFSLVRDATTSGWKIAAEGPGPIPNDGKQRILSLLRDQGPLTSNEIQQTLADENGSTVRSWIRRLGDEKRIIQGLDNKYALSTGSSASHLFPEA
jgi:hypothetical protein